MDAVRCPNCGYDLAGLIELRCPECGFGLLGWRSELPGPGSEWPRTERAWPFASSFLSAGMIAIGVFATVVTVADLFVPNVQESWAIRSVFFIAGGVLAPHLTARCVFSVTLRELRHQGAVSFGEAASHAVIMGIVAFVLYGFLVSVAAA